MRVGPGPQIRDNGVEACRRHSWAGRDPLFFLWTKTTFLGAGQARLELILSEILKSDCLYPSAVLHGNNLLVFGGTGIPFGENNGNDVHVCNVQYKRWNLLNCRGKKPNKIYGQVAAFSSGPQTSPGRRWRTDIHLRLMIAGDDHHKRLPVRVRRNDGLPLQHWPAPAGPDHQGVDPPEAQQCPLGSTWRKVLKKPMLHQLLGLTCFNWKMNVRCCRYRHELVHDGHRIYILGGGTSWTSYPLDKVG